MWETCKSIKKRCSTVRSLANGSKIQSDRRTVNEEDSPLPLRDAGANENHITKYFLEDRSTVANNTAAEGVE